MADIDVVPRSRSNVWLWVVLAIIAVVALWFLFGRNQTARTSSQLSSPAQIWTLSDLAIASAGQFV